MKLEKRREKTEQIGGAVSDGKNMCKNDVEPYFS